MRPITITNSAGGLSDPLRKQMTGAELEHEAAVLAFVQKVKERAAAASAMLMGGWRAGADLVGRRRGQLRIAWVAVCLPAGGGVRSRGPC